MFLLRLFGLAILLGTITLAANYSSKFKDIDLFLGQHPHSGLVKSEDSMSIKCTFCKYSIQYLCSAFIGHTSANNQEILQGVAFALTAVCNAVLPSLHTNVTCDGDIVPTIMSDFIDIVDVQIAPNACFMLDNSCPRNIIDSC